MKLSEYDDEDLIEEIKKRGIKIEVPEIEFTSIMTSCGRMPHMKARKVVIGGVTFDITK